MSLIQDALRRQEEDRDKDGDGDKKEDKPKATESAKAPTEKKSSEEKKPAAEPAKTKKSALKKIPTKPKTPDADKKESKPAIKQKAPAEPTADTPPPSAPPTPAEKKSLKIISKAKVSKEPTPEPPTDTKTVTVAEAAAKAAAEAESKPGAPSAIEASTPPPPPPPPPTSPANAAPSVLSRKSPIQKIDPKDESSKSTDATPSAPPPPPPPPAKDEVPMPPPPPPSSKNDAKDTAPESQQGKEEQDKNQNSPQKKKAKKKSGGMGALIGTLGVLLLLGGGVGFAFWKGYISMDMLTGGDGDTEIVDNDAEGQNSIPPENQNETNETLVATTGTDLSETNDTVIVANPPDAPEPDPLDTNTTIEVVSTPRITLTLKHRLQNGNDVNSVDVSPDGTMIVSYAGREKANLWNALTGTLKERIAVPSLHALRFDNSGNHIIFHGSGLTVYLIEDKRSIQTHDWLAPDTGGSMNAIDISKDGRLAALGGANSKVILLWSLADNSQKRKITLPVGNGASDLSFSHDGTRLAVAGTDYVHLFNVITGEEVFHINASVPDQVALSPDGKHAVHLVSSEVIAVINTTDGEQERLIEDTGKMTLTELLFSADGKYLMGSSWDGHVYVWDFETGAQVAKVQAHDEWITSMALAENGKTLITGSDDDSIGVWDLQGLPALTINAPDLAEDAQEIRTAPDSTPPEDPAPPVATNIVEAVPLAPVQWPSLKINGLMGQGEKGAVIINDDIIRIGYTYNDVKVIEIKGKTVVLEYKNEIRKLMVGSSTN